MEGRPEKVPNNYGQHANASHDLEATAVATVVEPQTSANQSSISGMRDPHEYLEAIRHLRRLRDKLKEKRRRTNRLSGQPPRQPTSLSVQEFNNSNTQQQNNQDLKQQTMKRDQSLKFGQVEGDSLELLKSSPSAAATMEDSLHSFHSQVIRTRNANFRSSFNSIGDQSLSESTSTSQGNDGSRSENTSNKNNYSAGIILEKEDTSENKLAHRITSLLDTTVPESSTNIIEEGHSSSKSSSNKSNKKKPPGSTRGPKPPSTDSNNTRVLPYKRILPLKEGNRRRSGIYSRSLSLPREVELQRLAHNKDASSDEDEDDDDNSSSNDEDDDDQHDHEKKSSGLRRASMALQRLASVESQNNSMHNNSTHNSAHNGTHNGTHNSKNGKNSKFKSAIRRITAVHKSTLSFMALNSHTFIISSGDVDAKAIAQYMGIPKYEISKVDHDAAAPGQAYSHGYVRRRVEVRKKAIEAISVSYEKFSYRKSFWVIVPKIPFGTKKIVFTDEKRRVLRHDKTEGDQHHHSSSSLSSKLDYNSDDSIDKGEELAVPEEDDIDSPFYVKRARRSVVLVRSGSDASYVDNFNEFRIPDLDLPEGYDLLINPFFFDGANYEEEVARDICYKVVKKGEIYVSTLSPITGRGFFFCFGKAWQSFVTRITTRCRQGREKGMSWPKFLNKIDSIDGPAPAYYDIPRGYWITAAGMLLGIYENIGVRELWATGGLVGFYSFARRVPALDSNRDMAMTFAMLREATWGCRSQKVGVRLLHNLPSYYHNDYRAFCTYPWSKCECISRKLDTSYYKPATAINTDCDASSEQQQQKESASEITKKIVSPLLMPKHADGPAVKLVASRYIVSVRDPKARPMMNFLAAVGLEMLGVAYPTLNEDYMNVVSGSFLDCKDAKRELRRFSNRERLLPGAAIRGGDPTGNNGGILNVVQEDIIAKDGHVRWMRKYNFFDSIVTMVLILFASYYGWVLNTGIFHFILAITVLTRINEEISVFGTFNVLVYGRHYGYLMYQDSLAQFLVPASLGAVEAAYELIVEEERVWIPRATLICGGATAAGIIFCTLLARLKYKQTKGETYEQVMERDGSIECLLTGENETGFRSIDHPNVPGVGPLQAQFISLCETDGGEVATSSASAPYHLSGRWMIAGRLQKNHGLKVGIRAANLIEQNNGAIHSCLSGETGSKSDICESDA